ncbi:hypothetical protein C8Q76DRAFT_723673 [Earliella scabrosa]|nr:hypothetical protein C8Q76DRAFT_723673 [Earliella scabrosa]
MGGRHTYASTSIHLLILTGPIHSQFSLLAQTLYPRDVDLSRPATSCLMTSERKFFWIFSVTMDFISRSTDHTRTSSLLLNDVVTTHVPH